MYDNNQSIYKTEDDGKTHINIFSRSRSKLGKMLSNFYNADFTHPVFGKFANMECFWYYVKTGCRYEGLRNLPAYEAKIKGKQLPLVHIDNFMEIMKEGIRIKILSHNSILTLFRRCKLPFDHYYVIGPREHQYRPGNSDQLVKIFDELKVEFNETKPWLNPSQHLHSSVVQTTN